VPRLFIALPIAEDVIAELARVARDGPRDWRWVKPDAMHLTLAFLGEVEEGRVAAAERALRRGAEGAPALELAAAGLGAFPDQRRARVLWAGVAGDLRQLAALQTGIALGGRRRRPAAARRAADRYRAGPRERGLRARRQAVPPAPHPGAGARPSAAAAIARPRATLRLVARHRGAPLPEPPGTAGPPLRGARRGRAGRHGDRPLGRPV